MSDETQVSESALAAAAGIDRNDYNQCCGSCHEDDELGYDMCEVDGAIAIRYAALAEPES